MASRRLTEVARAGMHRAAERRVHSGDISTEDDVRKYAKKAYGKSRADRMHGSGGSLIGYSDWSGKTGLDCGGLYLWTGSSSASAGEPSQPKRVELGRRCW